VSKTTAIIYSSHHLAEVEVTCDVVSIINEGKLLFDDELTNISKSDTKYVVEVSPHSIVKTIEGKETQRIDDDWIRCKVPSANVENLSKEINRLDGSLRLLQPESQSLELAYLNIIQNQTQIINNQS
jgi:ABC-type multidrug transport system ATPase subunit